MYDGLEVGGFVCLLCFRHTGYSSFCKGFEAVSGWKLGLTFFKRKDWWELIKSNIHSSRCIKGFESKNVDTTWTFTIMPLGSRWQALLFSELGFYFLHQRMPKFEEAGLNHWNMSFLGSGTLNQLFRSLYIIAFLWMPNLQVPSLQMVRN